MNIKNAILKTLAATKGHVCTTRQVHDFLHALDDSIGVNKVTWWMLRLAKEGIVAEYGMAYSRDPDEPTEGAYERQWKLTRLGMRHPVVIDRKYT